jgi:capsular polysaccharide biosynthesis protein
MTNMNLREITNLILRKKQLLALFSILFGAIFFAVSTVFTPEYRSDISMLVIQRQPEDKVDAFSAAKSADYLSDIFSKIIYTDSFVDDVFKSPMGIERQLPGDREDRKKEWKRIVNVKKVNNTGIIEVSVYDKSQKEAEKISQAIAWNLSTNSSKYHGGGERVTISTIDGPITSVRPYRPNILVNSALGLVIGFLGSLSYIYFFRNQKERELEKLIRESIKKYSENPNNQ